MDNVSQIDRKVCFWSLQMSRPGCQSFHPTRDSELLYFLCAIVWQQFLIVFRRIWSSISTFLWDNSAPRVRLRWSRDTSWTSAPWGCSPCTAWGSPPALTWSWRRGGWATSRPWRGRCRGRGAWPMGGEHGVTWSAAVLWLVGHLAGQVCTWVARAESPQSAATPTPAPGSAPSTSESHASAVPPCLCSRIVATCNTGDIKWRY